MKCAQRCPHLRSHCTVKKAQAHRHTDNMQGICRGSLQYGATSPVLTHCSPVLLLVLCCVVVLGWAIQSRK